MTEAFASAVAMTVPVPVPVPALAAGAEVGRSGSACGAEGGDKKPPAPGEARSQIVDI